MQNTKEIVEKYENEMEEYREQMSEYNQQMDLYHKDTEKCGKFAAKLIRIEINVFHPKREDGSTSVHIFPKDYRKIVKAYNGSRKLIEAYQKYAVEVKCPNEPLEPLEPCLEVSIKYPDNITF